VRAERVSQRRLLEDIARAASMKLVLEGVPDRRLSVSFTDLPVDEGVRRIVRTASFVMLYSEGRLSELRMFGDHSPAPALVRRAGPPSLDDDDAQLQEILDVPEDDAPEVRENTTASRETAR
jgi:hypothetical protein